MLLLVIMAEASEEFNQLVGQFIKNKPKELVSFSNHESDDNIVKALMETIHRAGGVKEVWKPIMFGMVTKVEDYYLDNKIQKALKTKVKHEQKVTWLATNGFTFNYGWDDKKPFRKDIDIKDFPDGFQKNDFIRVEADGAFVTKIVRVSRDDVISALPEEIQHKFQLQLEKQHKQDENG